MTPPAPGRNVARMTDLASRLRRAPRPFDTDRAHEARAECGWASGGLAELIGGTAGCSPFLAGLIGREAAWLEAACADPEAAVEAELASFDGLDAAALAPRLRQAKRRVALIAALADLGGAWPLEEVTGSLTRLADAGLQAGLRALLAPQVARGKLPGITEADLETGAGMCVFAMGKMGAFELNYSSDIDLICLYDETRYDEADRHEARAILVRVTRQLAALIGDLTGEGYVFRTDLRLRPDAAVTPVCLSMGAAEQYYESVGRTWERAAWIKARPCAGDLAAGGQFVSTLRPFIWRRHLDFHAIRDAHDMRLKIRDHKGLGGALNLMGHDMKLGRGGIREIEFFTQTRQLISGGRDASLRVRGTVEGLERLAQAGWIEAGVAEGLTTHYRAHREVEHRVQMIADQQTHMLPSTEEGFARLAAFMDRDAAELGAELTERLEAVHELTEDFFAPGGAGEAVPDFGRETTARWPGYPALRSDRAVEIFDRLRPEILKMLSEAARPDEALAQFDAFLAGLPAGVQLFSLFEANPQLTRLLVDICATAPGLAKYLSRNAGVLDAVIGGGFFADWPGCEALRSELSDRLARQPDHEARLDAARVWAKEIHFRIGVHHLRGLIDADRAGQEYAELAEAAVAALVPVVIDDMARRHGPPPGRGLTVLAMGSLGAGRLGSSSDLDLIVIYDADGQDASDGPRPLAARAWYSRFTQGLITALSAPTSEGKLYEVDMRLRPSGRQGPVATALPAFRAYQQDEAWTWEHLALTRARPIAGEPALREEVEAFRRELIAEKARGTSVRDDLAAMRARLAEARPAQGGWALRDGPGRLQDVELFAQSLALRAGSPAREVPAQIAAGREAGLIGEDAAADLTEAAMLMRRVQCVIRLLTGGGAPPERFAEGGERLMLRETGAEDLDALRRALDARAERAEAVIAQALQGDGE
ncbi:glutamate-ammonia-ligase adenylyltransferase [Limimaricola pyoseonensis]|uniref:Glutamate-ammonia-ligase adenylyltransferase n=2 Tax=Limimaricola pyoseonensis TaxID=521013 RepID=A0A1G7ATL4_9RHOB|nr:glutamate-ammonia-ligase adenylyltransferase [Limimaricola pyoseonensis]